MPSSIMERSIVLVRFSIRSIWVKSFFQLRVALIDLAGQVFISIYKSFAEFGGCISHVAILAINGTSSFPLHPLVERFRNMLHSLKKTNDISIILENTFPRWKEKMQSYSTVKRQLKKYIVHKLSSWIAEIFPGKCTQIPNSSQIISLINCGPLSLCKYLHNLYSLNICKRNG